MSRLDHGPKIGLVNFGWSHNIDQLEWIGVNRSRNLMSEELLMLAVLEDAIKSFLHGIRLSCQYRKEENQKQLARETEDWLFHDNPDYVFSADSICERLGVNIDRLRRGLLKVREAA